jgi:hypothetical protein
MSRIRRGVVVEFEDERGLGVVEELVPEPEREGSAVKGARASNEAGEGDGEGEGEGDGAVSARYRFHATAIAGGTRMITAGTKVVFLVVPRQLGECEATEITPVLPDRELGPAGRAASTGRGARDLDEGEPDLSEAVSQRSRVLSEPLSEALDECTECIDGETGLH